MTPGLDVVGLLLFFVVVVFYNFLFSCLFIKWESKQILIFLTQNNESEKMKDVNLLLPSIKLHTVKKNLVNLGDTESKLRLQYTAHRLSKREKD